MQTPVYQNQQFKLLMESSFGDYVVPNDKSLLRFRDTTLLNQISNISTAQLDDNSYVISF